MLAAKVKRLVTYIFLFLIFIISFLFPHRVSAEEERTIIFVGDSRTVGMHATVKNTSWRELNDQEGNEVWIAKSGMSYNWFTETGMPEAMPYLENGNCDLVILMGCNDCINPDTANYYASYLADNNIAGISDTNRIFFASVGPMGHMGGGSETNYKNLENDGNVSQFNNNLRSSLPESVTYIDLYQAMVDNGYATADGVHYDGATNQYIYNYLMSEISAVRTASADSASTAKHKLTLDTDGGTLQGDYSSDVAEGQYVTGLPSVTRDGFRFTGWQMEDGTIVQQDFPMPDHDITLKATWKAMDHIPYTIVCQYEQPSGKPKEESETQYGTAGEVVSITPEDKEGYITPDAQTFSIDDNGSTKFVFFYKRQSYKITVKVEKGVNYKGLSTWRARYQSKINLDASCKPGYETLSYVGDIHTGTFYMPAKDCTITITAVPKVYHITYEGEHLVKGSQREEIYTIDDLPLKLQRTNCDFPYSFRGWLDADGNPINTITKPADLKVYADTVDTTFLILIILALIAASCAIIFFLFRDEIRKKKAGILSNHAEDANIWARDKHSGVSDSADTPQLNTENHTDTFSEKIPEEKPEAKSEEETTEAALIAEPEETEKSEKPEDSGKTENPEKAENKE